MIRLLVLPARSSVGNLPAVSVRLIASPTVRFTNGANFLVSTEIDDLTAAVDGDGNLLAPEAITILRLVFDLEPYRVFSGIQCLTIVFGIPDKETPEQARERYCRDVASRLSASGYFSLG